MGSSFPRATLAVAAVVAVAVPHVSCGGGGGAKEGSAATESKQQATATTPAAGGAANRTRPRDLETYMIVFDQGVYDSKIAPAFDKYVNSGDAEDLAKLTGDGVAIPNLPDRKQRYEAALKIAGPVVESRCLVKVTGSEPYQLGPSELVSYLYSASDWLREAFTDRDISDVTLDYPIGEFTEIIRPVDATEIRVNIRNIPMPEDAGIRKQLASLVAMMDAAGKNPKHVLALVMK